jgi:hypothetical protein
MQGAQGCAAVGERMMRKSTGILLALGLASTVPTASTAFAVPITYSAQAVLSGTSAGCRSRTPMSR